jgi:hypothetical protein
MRLQLNWTFEFEKPNKCHSISFIIQPPFPLDTCILEEVESRRNKSKNGNLDLENSCVFRWFYRWFLEWLFMRLPSCINTVTRDVFTQSLKFKYLYKSHCKSCELFLVLYNMVLFKSPQQFIGFAVTLVKILNF